MSDTLCPDCLYAASVSARENLHEQFDREPEADEIDAAARGYVIYGDSACRRHGG